MKVIGIKLIVITGIVFLTISSLAQESIKTADFKNIFISDSFSAILSQSDSNTVFYSDKTDSIFKFEIIENTLYLKNKKNQLPKPETTVYIGVKALKSLKVSESATVRTANTLLCDSLIIESSGSGDTNLKINAATILTEQKGTGDLILRGNTKTLNSKINGLGDLRATELISDTVIVLTADRGSARVYAEESLSASILGEGAIIYKGKPSQRKIAISGTGSVRESISGSGNETIRDSMIVGSENKKRIFDFSDEKWNEQLKKPSLIEFNKPFKNWVGLELGLNGLLDINNSTNLPPNADFLELKYQKSIVFGINLLEKNFHIYHNYVNIVTGLGFDFMHYSFEKDITLNSKTSTLTATEDSLFLYKKNKLNISYLKVPVLLDINTSTDSKNNIHFSVGFEFALRLHAVAKQKKIIDAKKYKLKQRDDFYLQPVKFSSVFRIGYNNFTVYANYGISRLFKQGKGPQVYPFAIGITLNFND